MWHVAASYIRFWHGNWIKILKINILFSLEDTVLDAAASGAAFLTIDFLSSDFLSSDFLSFDFFFFMPNLLSMVNILFVAQRTNFKHFNLQKQDLQSKSMYQLPNSRISVMIIVGDFDYNLNYLRGAGNPYTVDYRDLVSEWKSYLLKLTQCLLRTVKSLKSRNVFNRLSRWWRLCLNDFKHFISMLSFLIYKQ